MTRDPAVVIGWHGDPDPAVTIDRLEAEGFEVSQDDSGYRVEGAVGGKNNARVLPDAKALYWWWLGWWCGRFQGHVRAKSRSWSASRRTSESDPAVTISRLEVEGFVVSRQCAGGYRVEGTMGDEDNARVLPPDAKALYWWWLGFVERRYRLMSGGRRR